ncbi:MAG: hypothetical protein ACFBQW_04455 [Sphingomonadaceae bacterium]
MAQRFKAVGWVGAVAAAAVGCYLLSARVATEREELAAVEAEIVRAQEEIRALQTEIVTRGRLSELERWNEEVLALAAPASGQFAADAFVLAAYHRPAPSLEERAEVTLAAAARVPAEAGDAEVVLANLADEALAGTEPERGTETGLVHANLYVERGRDRLREAGEVFPGPGIVEEIRAEAKAEAGAAEPAGGQ